MSTPGTEQWMRENFGPPCDPKLVSVELVPDFKHDPGTGVIIQVDQSVARMYRFFSWALLEYAPKYAQHVDDVRDDWVYNCRHIGDDPTRPWSNHAWAVALDLDSTKNPFGSEGQIRRCHEFLRVISVAGFRWGGAYTTTKDGMHFEPMITRKQIENRFKVNGEPQTWMMKRIREAA